jgi:hypothetical protein
MAIAISHTIKANFSRQPGSESIQPYILKTPFTPVVTSPSRLNQQHPVRVASLPNLPVHSTISTTTVFP